jgi:predicted dehydrogenase
MNRKLRMGMVGGGRDAFIGAVHRMAANLDGQIELVAGCFSSDPEKSRLSGEDLFLDPGRVYVSYEDMAAQEAALPEDKRIDFVSIVTPNHLHAPVATAFLRKGIHVVCDKPMTLTLDEAVALKAEVKSSGCIFALTHNYTIEQDGQKQAAWRTDPARAGASCCIGDIGTHAENLARYITGLEIEALCAEFNTFVPGRNLEDDGNLLVRYQGGATGILYASQISAGEENNLRIRVYGRKGSLAWAQEHPNELTVHPKGEPARTWRRGNDYVGESAQKFTRIPFGHPEAFLEAFANIYLEAVRHIRDRIAGNPEGDYDYPTVDDGIEGMAFITTAVASAHSDLKWTPMIQPNT